jgi:hypothetical protein
MVDTAVSLYLTGLFLKEQLLAQEHGRLQTAAVRRCSAYAGDCCRLCDRLLLPDWTPTVRCCRHSCFYWLGSAGGGHELILSGKTTIFRVPAEFAEIGGLLPDCRQKTGQAAFLTDTVMACALQSDEQSQKKYANDVGFHICPVRQPLQMLSDYA